MSSQNITKNMLPINAFGITCYILIKPQCRRILHQKIQFDAKCVDIANAVCNIKIKMYQLLHWCKMRCITGSMVDRRMLL